MHRVYGLIARRPETHRAVLGERPAYLQGDRNNTAGLDLVPHVSQLGLLQRQRLLELAHSCPLLNRLLLQLRSKQHTEFERKGMNIAYCTVQNPLNLIVLGFYYPRFETTW